MPLIPQSDEDYLDDRAFDYELNKVENEVYLVLRQWPFPEAYAPRVADVLIRILPGYPLSPLDMFWTSPDVKLVNGAWPQAADVHENHAGQVWQRWSRHTQEWRAGIDNLRTFITAIKMEINRGL
jgi:hypothetical protein